MSDSINAPKDSEEKTNKESKISSDENKEYRAQKENNKLEDDELEKLNSKYPFGDFGDMKEKRGNRGKRSKDILVIETRDDSIEKKIKVIDVKRREEKRERARRGKEEISPPLDSSSSLDEPIYACVNKTKTGFNLTQTNLEKAKETNITVQANVNDQDDIYENEATFDEPPDVQEDIYTEVYNPLPVTKPVNQIQSKSKHECIGQPVPPSIVNPNKTSETPVLQSSSNPEGSLNISSSQDVKINLTENLVSSIIVSEKSDLDSNLFKNVEENSLKDTKINKSEDLSERKLETENRRDKTIDLGNIKLSSDTNSVIDSPRLGSVNPDTGETKPDSDTKHDALDSGNTKLKSSCAETDLPTTKHEESDQKSNGADIPKKEENVQLDQKSVPALTESSSESPQGVSKTPIDKENTKSKAKVDTISIEKEGPTIHENSEEVIKNKSIVNNNNKQIGLVENKNISSEKDLPYPQPYEVDDVLSTFM